MPWTAFPLAENVTSVLELMHYGNSVTNNMFGMTIPFSIFVIALMMMYGRVRTEDSVIVASFLGWTFSMFLKVLGIVGDPIVVTFILLTAGALVAALVQKRTYDV